jgi:hypothetical protein
VSAGASNSTSRVLSVSIFKEHTPIASQVRADIPEQNYGGNVQIFCMLPKAKQKRDNRDEKMKKTKKMKECKRECERNLSRFLPRTCYFILFQLCMLFRYMAGPVPAHSQQSLDD